MNNEEHRCTEHLYNTGVSEDIAPLGNGYVNLYVCEVCEQTIKQEIRPLGFFDEDGNCLSVDLLEAALKRAKEAYFKTTGRNPDKVQV